MHSAPPFELALLPVKLQYLKVAEEEPSFIKRIAPPLPLVLLVAVLFVKLQENTEF